MYIVHLEQRPWPCEHSFPRRCLEESAQRDSSSALVPKINFMIIFCLGEVDINIADKMGADIYYIPMLGVGTDKETMKTVLRELILYRYDYVDGDDYDDILHCHLI